MVRVTDLPSLVIANTGTNSNVLTSRDYGDAREITLFAPAAFDGTVTVEVNPDDDAASGFVTYQSPPGTDIVLAGGKAITIVATAFKQLRLHASVGQTGAKTTRANKTWGLA